MSNVSASSFVCGGECSCVGVCSLVDLLCRALWCVGEEEGTWMDYHWPDYGIDAAGAALLRSVYASCESRWRASGKHREKFECKLVSPYGAESKVGQ